MKIPHFLEQSQWIKKQWSHKSHLMGSVCTICDIYLRPNNNKLYHSLQCHINVTLWMLRIFITININSKCIKIFLRNHDFLHRMIFSFCVVLYSIINANRVSVITSLLVEIHLTVMSSHSWFSYTLWLLSAWQRRLFLIWVSLYEIRQSILYICIVVLKSDSDVKVNVKDTILVVDYSPFLKLTIQPERNSSYCVNISLQWTWIWNLTLCVQIIIELTINA